MFEQIIAPLSGHLTESFLMAVVPIATVLILLGVLRLPAWKASCAGLFVGLVLAVLVWQMPMALALNSVAAGAVFACWPIMWIVFNALVLYNLTVASGQFEELRRWMVAHLPDDRRVALVVIGFSFGCLLEGIAGFGAPIAITTALLVAVGFPALEALTFTLIFNTAPVAFGALGSPITTLGAVTQLPAGALGAMVGRQLPIIALILPFYVVMVYGGIKALRGVWPILLIAGGSFAAIQFLTSNFLAYELTDVLSSIASLAITLAFARIWRFPPDPAHALVIKREGQEEPHNDPGRDIGRAGWMPWLMLTIVVIIWIHFGINMIGRTVVQWPGLDQQVFITAYNRPYAALWDFQPLATGTAILAATLMSAAAARQKPAVLRAAIISAARQVRLPALTTSLIVGLAYLMNYSGIAYTLGVGVASVGPLFPFLSVFLGWLAVFLSGSDTSGNALFGNLQVVAANHLDLSPTLMAAANSSGGVMGKMISPQNIATGASVTELTGREGMILARTFKHSLILTSLLGIVVVLQQYVCPWMIPN